MRLHGRFFLRLDISSITAGWSMCFVRRTGRSATGRVDSSAVHASGQRGICCSAVPAGMLPDFAWGRCRLSRCRMNAWAASMPRRYTHQGTAAHPTRSRLIFVRVTEMAAVNAKKAPQRLLLSKLVYQASGSITNAGMAPLAWAVSRNLSAVTSASLMVTSMSR